MDSKTPPIQATPNTSATASNTKEQAMASQVVLRFLTANQLSPNIQTLLSKGLPPQLSLPIPANLLKQVSQWMQQVATLQSQNAGIYTSANASATDAKALTMEKAAMPQTIANWLTESLNKHSNQQGLPKLTLSQWMPLIAQMHLTKAANTQQELIRLVFQLGSTPPSALLSQELHQANKLNTKNDGIAQLLKLLVPIPLQDKASLIMRERQPSANETETQRTTNADPQHLTRSENEQIEKHQVSEREQADSSSSNENGMTTTLSFTLNFDLDSLGQLTIDFDLTGMQLQSSCTCSNLNLLSKVEEHWPTLEARLSKFGFAVKNQTTLAAEPQSLKSRGLIDIKA